MCVGSTSLSRAMCSGRMPQQPPMISTDRGWCYQAEHLAGAVRDASTRDAEGVPPGPWFRNRQTDERRPQFGR
jgi:transposase InsO family protein